MKVCFPHVLLHSIPGSVGPVYRNPQNNHAQFGTAEHILWTKLIPLTPNHFTLFANFFVKLSSVPIWRLSSSQNRDLWTFSYQIQLVPSSTTLPISCLPEVFRIWRFSISDDRMQFESDLSCDPLNAVVLRITKNVCVIGFSSRIKTIHQLKVW